ncbi:hypothetical protein VN97_g7865 [Penicillium thymicola]|uniref:Uncharacterized protein n=1 Tax=Penicillium thymicola TaxID=293382 RepID=A0AAI9TDU1_PENTH|nr:hypothetical protein VN97_g7865 [Penicillium thymicola]
MPVIFERRLAMYQQIKKNQTDMINSEPDSLSWEVVQRLDSLKKVQKSFRELGNDSGNTSNVEAIMVAYRSGDLVWDSNSVTFWVHGKLIGGPRKWHMDEFLAFTKEHGSLGVWVEGVDNYKPEPMNLFATLAPSFSGYDMHMFVVSVRNPNTWRTNTWAHTIHIPVLEDSGASQMKIFQSDRLSLEGMSGAPLPFTGTATFGTAAGDIEADSVILHVNLVHNGQTMLPHWIKVRSSVGREDGSTPPMSFRLSGIWLHHMLYCLSAPDNTGNMYVGTDLFEITTTLPPCDLDLANPPYQI